MTHGAGGISHGGGGYSGGVGFSTGAFHTSHYMHSSRNRDGSDGDCGECCCAICSLVFFLLCMKKMKPKTRILLTWFYCVLGAGLVGGLIGRHYSSTSLSASPADIRKVDRVSPIFCQSVLIDSSSQIMTYKFKSTPRINQTSSVHYEKSIRASISRNSYEYWGFYLLEGSTVVATVCPDNRLDLYIIKGKNNLDDWIANADCVDCFERNYYIFYCSFQGSAQEFKFTASTSDQFYFLFANDGYSIIAPGPTVAQVDFRLVRKTYDMHGSEIVCSHDFDCDVSVPISGTTSVVFYVPPENSFDSSLTLYCRPRVYMYIILFVILPVTCGILVTLLILRKSRKSNGQNSRSDSQIFAVSTSDQLHGYANESCQINTSPPSYSEAPPSYEEAVARG